jgi:hypothetical protein
MQGKRFVRIHLQFIHRLADPLAGKSAEIGEAGRAASLSEAARGP